MKKYAGLIGSVTVLSYVANYFLRNMLGVLTPFMLKTSGYTKEYLAMLSSVYMIAYAAGQLFNGVLGDILKPRSMVLCGLTLAGAASMIFPIVSLPFVQIACFLVLGYGLSMVRGPLMKVISENMRPSHARVTCVFFSFSSFAGPLVAGMLSMLFRWETAFVAAGGLTILIALGAYLALMIMERKGVIACRRIEHVSLREILSVFQLEGFGFYLVIACLVESAGAAMSFWIPTFLNEYIRFDEGHSNMIFSAISLIRALVPFAALMIYRLFDEDEVRIMRMAYMLAFLSFAAAFVIPAGSVTVILLLLALMMNSLVSALLWSIYIPSLGKTGRVSGINGILDCSGYIAASVATTAFAWVVKGCGWRGLIAAWGLMQLFGVAVTECKRRKR